MYWKSTSLVPNPIRPDYVFKCLNAGRSFERQRGAAGQVLDVGRSRQV